jgi:hypothetical protein
MKTDLSPHSPGILFVWTDVDPAYEDDFNRWYDREHVAERRDVPGMRSAIRYRAVTQDGRRYLGLYRAENLDVFRSAAYQQVFQHQTPWSVTNLGRMRNTVRRVCTIQNETGLGAGAWLVVVRQGSNVSEAGIAALNALASQVAEMDGVVATRVLLPDAGLSTPLPAEPAKGRVLDPILLIESTSEPVAAGVARLANDAAPAGEIATLNLLWHLGR